MKRERQSVTPDRPDPGHWPERAERRLAAPPSGSQAPVVSEELDGQLGPDELPDGSEVAMNREAKLHH